MPSMAKTTMSPPSPPPPPPPPPNKNLYQPLKSYQSFHELQSEVRQRIYLGSPKARVEEKKKRRAWYQPCTHVQVLPRLWVNCILSVHPSKDFRCSLFSVRLGVPNSSRAQRRNYHYYISHHCSLLCCTELLNC